MCIIKYMLSLHWNYVQKVRSVFKSVSYGCVWLVPWAKGCQILPLGPRVSDWEEETAVSCVFAHVLCFKFCLSLFSSAPNLSAPFSQKLKLLYEAFSTHHLSGTAWPGNLGPAPVILIPGASLNDLELSEKRGSGFLFLDFQHPAAPDQW